MTHLDITVIVQSFPTHGSNNSLRDKNANYLDFIHSHSIKILNYTVPHEDIQILSSN